MMAGPGQGAGKEVRPRSWFEVRWRQFRNAPRPVVRAVAADASVAILAGLLDRKSVV